MMINLLSSDVTYTDIPTHVYDYTYTIYRRNKCEIYFSLPRGTYNLDFQTYIHYTVSQCQLYNYNKHANMLTKFEKIVYVVLPMSLSNMLSEILELLSRLGRKNSSRVEEIQWISSWGRSVRYSCPSREPSCFLLTFVTSRQTL